MKSQELYLTRHDDREKEKSQRDDTRMTPFLPLSGTEEAILLSVRPICIEIHSVVQILSLISLFFYWLISEFSHKICSVL